MNIEQTLTQEMSAAIRELDDRLTGKPLTLISSERATDSHLVAAGDVYVLVQSEMGHSIQDAIDPDGEIWGSWLNASLPGGSEVWSVDADAILNDSWDVRVLVPEDALAGV